VAEAVCQGDHAISMVITTHLLHLLWWGISLNDHVLELPLLTYP
jgi:hypothetical protein